MPRAVTARVVVAELRERRRQSLLPWKMEVSRRLGVPQTGGLCSTASESAWVL